MKVYYKKKFTNSYKLLQQNLMKVGFVTLVLLHKQVNCTSGTDTVSGQHSAADSTSRDISLLCAVPLCVLSLLCQSQADQQSRNQPTEQLQTRRFPTQSGQSPKPKLCLLMTYRVCWPSG